MYTNKKMQTINFHLNRERLNENEHSNNFHRINFHIHQWTQLRQHTQYGMKYFLADSNSSYVSIVPTHQASNRIIWMIAAPLSHWAGYCWLIINHILAAAQDLCGLSLECIQCYEQVQRTKYSIFTFESNLQNTGVSTSRGNIKLGNYLLLSKLGPTGIMMDSTYFLPEIKRENTRKSNNNSKKWTLKNHILKWNIIIMYLLLLWDFRNKTIAEHYKLLNNKTRKL